MPRTRAALTERQHPGAERQEQDDERADTHARRTLHAAGGACGCSGRARGVSGRQSWPRAAHRRGFRGVVTFVTAPHGRGGAGRRGWDPDPRCATLARCGAVQRRLWCSPSPLRGRPAYLLGCCARSRGGQGGESRAKRGAIGGVEGAGIALCRWLSGGRPGAAALGAGAQGRERRRPRAAPAPTRRRQPCARQGRPAGESLQLRLHLAAARAWWAAVHGYKLGPTQRRGSKGGAPRSHCHGGCDGGYAPRACACVCGCPAAWRCCCWC
jgi:hypothetical protein